MGIRSLYCPSCKSYVDFSEITKWPDGTFTHTVVKVLTAGGETKEIVHLGLRDE